MGFFFMWVMVLVLICRVIIFSLIWYLVGFISLIIVGILMIVIVISFIVVICMCLFLLWVVVL